MSKKRTRKQKERAAVRIVNSQFIFEQTSKAKEAIAEKKALDTVNINQIASTKKELARSLTIALLILASLAVLYWFS